MRLDSELTCADIVELVTEYLEQRMTPANTERFEEHLSFCDGCDRYLHQMRATIAATGRLRHEDLPSELRERLLDAFRVWRTA
jgi:hypothetical protein